jgi:hypothetical protein
MAETWPTLDDIAAARQRYEAKIPGWQRPAAWALTKRDADGVEVVQLNVDGHHLPAVVIASVVGHVAGSAAYDLDQPTLLQVNELIAPAEACTEIPHPNLWALQKLAKEGHGVTVVYVGDMAQPADDPAVETVRQAAANEKGS